MLRKSVMFVMAVCALFASVTGLYGGPQKSSLDQVIDAFLAPERFPEVAISPDGRLVAWVASLHGPNEKVAPATGIYLADLNSLSAPPRRITACAGATACDEHGIAWSPDSRRIAFLSALNLKVKPNCGWRRLPMGGPASSPT